MGTIRAKRWGGSFPPVFRHGATKGIHSLIFITSLVGTNTTNQLYRILSPSVAWTNHVVPLSLPPNIRLLLADVDAGSDTPSLVGKVLKWRKDNPELCESSPRQSTMPCS